MGAATPSFFGVLMAQHHARGLRKQSMWVKQEHENGCVVASLAMVLGVSYATVHDELAPQICWYDHSEPYADTDAEREAKWHKGTDFSLRGMSSEDAYRWLEREKRYATQLRHKYIWGHEPVPEWPPKPFAPIHMCSVLTPSNNWHEIVMLADGELLDPNRAPGTWEENFSFYKQVGHVCGLWRARC